MDHLVGAGIDIGTGGLVAEVSGGRLLYTSDAADEEECVLSVSRARL